MKAQTFFTWMIALALLTHQARAMDTNAVLNGWLAAQSRLQNWTADFTQTRRLKTLTQPLVATGHVWFAVPNRFRWELREPSQTIALRQADGMFVIYPQLKRAEHYSLNADTPAQWREALSMLEAGFPRNRAELEKSFHIGAIEETNGVWQLTLVPASTFVKRMMTEIRVGLATNDFALASTELVFVDGSSMRNDFTNGVMNTKFDEAIFEWKPPPDFTVTEPLGK